MTMGDISSISGIRANSNYPYSRKLTELYSWISGLFFKFTFFGSPMVHRWFRRRPRIGALIVIAHIVIVVGSYCPVRGFVELWLIFFLFHFSILNKLIIEGIHMVFDVVDANIVQVAYLSSLNKSSVNSSNEGDDNIPPEQNLVGISELKDIANQFKQQSEALKKSIDELSEKAEKTNTYLYHIYKK